MIAGKRLRVTPKEKSVFATMYKAIVAAAQLGAQAIAFGLLHGTALHVTALVIAGLGLIGVYTVPNAPKEVIAGTAELEARLVDLENVVPDLPDLVDAIGKVVANGITTALGDNSLTTLQATVVGPLASPVPVPVETPAPEPAEPATPDWVRDASPGGAEPYATPEAYASSQGTRVPVRAGEVQLEWHRDGWDVEMEFKADGVLDSIWVGRSTHVNGVRRDHQASPSTDASADTLNVVTEPPFDPNAADKPTRRRRPTPHPVVPEENS